MVARIVRVKSAKTKGAKTKGAGRELAIAAPSSSTPARLHTARQTRVYATGYPGYATWLRAAPVGSSHVNEWKQANGRKARKYLKYFYAAFEPAYTVTFPSSCRIPEAGDGVRAGVRRYTSH